MHPDEFQERSMGNRSAADLALEYAGNRLYRTKGRE
jgi:hypothetical protein